MSNDALTRDEILRGTLVIQQPKRGYRFAVDPLLLVDFALRGRKKSLGRVADFGTGSGVVALATARRDERARVIAIEVQPRLQEIAENNVRENGLADRVTVVLGDICDGKRMKKIVEGGSCDWVLSNPPFRPLGEGDANPHQESAIARHEVRMTLEKWLGEARRVLKSSGRVALIYPAERTTRLLSALEAAGLRPLRLRPIYPRPGEPATRVVVEAQKSAKGNLVLEAPWFVRDELGTYTRETAAALGE